MIARGYARAFAESIFEQIKGFSEYGFPESHAASFALLVYASCWIKCVEPAAFLAAMLNSQPLGFYSPSQLVQDARRHGVEVRAVDVMASDVDATLEDDPCNSCDAPDLPHSPDSTNSPPSSDQPAVRLGLRLLSSLRHESALRIVAARRQSPFECAGDLSRRAGLALHEMKLLAAGDALVSLSGHRRQQVWEASALQATPALLRDAPTEEDWLELPPAPEGEEIVWDYAATSLTLRHHPLALLRPRLARRGFLPSGQLRELPNGQLVRACGLVTLRQQPETASGKVFVSPEDEDGAVQVIIWKRLRERQRRELLSARLLGVAGLWQREGEVRSLIAHQLSDLSDWLGRLGVASRDFR